MILCKERESTNVIDINDLFGRMFANETDAIVKLL